MTEAEGIPLYRDLMRFKPEGLTANGWAVKAGVSRSVWADMRRHGNPSRRTLAKLLAVAGSSLAEFEALQIGEVPKKYPATSSPTGVSDAGASDWHAPPMAPLPLYLSVIAGEYGQHIEMTEFDPGAAVEQLARPGGLGDCDAYGLTVVGDSMWPRFRPGRRVIVSPKAPVAIGDDVVVQLRADDGGCERRAVRALIKELVRRTAGFVELRQFNPDVTFRVEADEIAAIHKVIGEAI